MIIALEQFIQWVGKDGLPSQRAAEYLETMTRQVNFNTVDEGAGSPEGVISAEPKKLYMDTAGTAGSILYIKKTGAGNTGWVVV